MWNILHARITKETYSLPFITAVREEKKERKRVCNISMEVKLQIHLYQSLVPMVSTQNSLSALPKSRQCPSLQTQASPPSRFHVALSKRSKTSVGKAQTNRSCHIHVLEELIPVWEVLLCEKGLLYLPWDCASSAKDGVFTALVNLTT